MLKIRDRLSEVTDAVNRLRDARQQIDRRLQATRSDAAAARAAESAAQRLLAIEGALIQLIDPNHPNLIPPKGPAFKLASLSGVIGRADAKPTRQVYLVFEGLTARVARQLELLEEVLQLVDEL
jgi:hypothetical protein